LLNAPTGSGKTFALFLPFLAEYINQYPDTYRSTHNNGLMMLWITPLRALTNDIKSAMQTVCNELSIPITIGSRTGDTPASEKLALRKNLPEVLLTTPESLHLMLAQKDYPVLFSRLQVVVIDEWHELLGTKRGVQIELGLSRLKAIRTGKLKVWGISATIGNLEQALHVLLGSQAKQSDAVMIKASLKKKLIIESVIPDNIETYSWAGHIGLSLLPKVMDIVARGKTTLIFTNTRSQSEIWYQAILDKYPEYAGYIAMHHGSLDHSLRSWVEQALHEGSLKLVVCTSSLDLGVDFRPVDSIIQIGSPKGVARFMQRAGRSGHSPGAVSKAYFVPTHSLELLEGAALKQALKEEVYESRDPIVLAMDVLVQYLVTIAVSTGFTASEIYREITSTYAYADLSQNEFSSLLDFITLGGKALSQYDEFLKVEIEDTVYKVNSRRIAMRHRLNIGTITSEVSLRVRFLSGGVLGSIEESFISKLKAGDKFWFAGRSLEFLYLKELNAYVKKSNAKKGIIPSWLGGRMPLSSQLSAVLRHKLDQVATGQHKDIEIQALKPLFDLQFAQSHIPRDNEFLIEKLASKEGYHLFFYPFEGRLVHEGMASLFAYRLSKIKKASFSIAMNDYGFELLTDEDLPLDEAVRSDLFSTDNLLIDIQHSLNANEMAKRRFRDIAHIGGLLFTGYPGKLVKNKHLQMSSSLLFDVFRDYDPDNLLLKQSYQEALTLQLEEFRLREALKRISSQTLVVKKIIKPSPFCFPILVDSLGREKFSTESIEDRVAKMALQFSKF